MKYDHSTTPEIYYQEAQPSPVLSAVVKCYGIIEYNLNQDLHFIEDFLPFGVPYLNVTYRGWQSFDQPPFRNREYSDDHIAGQLLNPFNLNHNGNFGIFGIFFQPTGLFYLLRHKMSVFTQNAFKIEHIFGGEGILFINRIKEAETFEQKIAVAEEFLQRKLQNQKISKDLVDQAIFLIRQNSSIQIDKLSKNFSISGRHLRRKFEEKIGIGPKSYLRILRFHQVLRLSRQLPNHNWQDLAFGCGYYDQSHFINDFKKFTGRTPYEYFIKNNRCIEAGGITVDDL